MSLVELADQTSRRRAVIVAVFALAFLTLSLLWPPFFGVTSPIAERMNARMWGFAAIAILATLATGGGLLGRRRLRTLVNDEVAHANRRTATAAGYWIAMLAALAIYVLPMFREVSSRETVFLIATPSIGLALLTFAWLERRAHRDG
jgi:hypothetical protein